MYNYANEVAKHIEGAEVKRVEKANGVVCYGISKRFGNIAPCVYVNGYYERKWEPEDAARDIEELLQKVMSEAPDISGLPALMTYENVRPKLRARLYNAKTKADVCQPATEWGFDDLIIVPYIIIEEGELGIAASKVTCDLLAEWKVSEAEVIKDALKNSEAEVEEREIWGLKAITNKTKVCGAISILFVLDKYKAMYPEGVVVIPSSINDTIVQPYTEDCEDIYNTMVYEVNRDVVNPMEVLSDHAYFFK
jgi:hypothetical protein